MKKSSPQPDPQNPETQNPDPLYAQVNKQPHRRGGPRIPSPEEIQAANRRQPLQGASPYDTPRGRSNAQENTPYNTPRTGAGGYDTPLSQQPQETPYAPQYPLGATRAAAAAIVGRGSREPSPENPTNPYAVVNLGTGETEFQERINPLYDSPNGSTQDLRHPQKQEEHLYAEIDPRTQSGRAPHKPIESVYAMLGMGAGGGQEPQQRENPLYEGVGRAATPPPQTPKDVVTSKLLQHTDFQYGVRETQEWCKVVYGNQHALNEQLAKVLENPQGADRVLWDLAAHPESAGKLAGRQVLGVKSPDRKAAEEGFSPLCSALERHIDKTKKLHKQFTNELERERGEKQESPERDEHRRHHHRRHHARGQNPDSPEHSPQRQRHGEKGMAYAM
ncbi:BID domain-containing T4SS effector [Bartonella krasnovii]|uniref:BID domain-containing T4SS effector n=1 Tax=Bartonella krasnovii TaxID=2267275 RepID=UPI001F4CB86D|nr:BID domain-containing T4SS effector [Bartonella krasnovii]UNF35114.1 BID domain-containing T4SS effector [Bartonella krasnovii]UNF36743.1 BID domain-containing T4SS effector [Bartonella krasnovii]UNF41728.1 BID domain-containing T4SS effector [Bartonella krasnovii]UNF46578.1 BID domain-containing T4SS effector [Bartonella krasnovii]UNF48287.1 BID domain-containing T4SS effector [Bartonella krasnovii]